MLLKLSKYLGPPLKRKRTTVYMAAVTLLVFTLLAIAVNIVLVCKVISMMVDPITGAVSWLV